MARSIECQPEAGYADVRMGLFTIVEPAEITIKPMAHRTTNGFYRRCILQPAVVNNPACGHKVCFGD